MRKLLSSLILLLAIGQTFLQADTIVFKSGKTSEGTVTTETAQTVTLENPLTGLIELDKADIADIKRSAPATTANSAATVSGAAEVQRVAGRSEDALNLIIQAAQNSPASAGDLSQEFTVIYYQLLERAQKFQQNSDFEAARKDFLTLYNALRSASAQVLMGSVETYTKILGTVSSGLAEVDFQLAQRIAKQPAMMPQVQQYLVESVQANPQPSLANDTHRLELARVAKDNRDYKTALENYQVVSKSQTSTPEMQRRADDGISQVLSITGQGRATPPPRPTVIAAVPVRQTPVVVAGPTPVPTPETLPADAPKWKKILYDIQNSSAYEQIKSAPDYLGDYAGVLIGVPLVIIVLWVLPYMFLSYRANRGDILAAEMRPRAKTIGVIAVGMWLTKQLKAGPPKNRCPFCNKGIDNIDSYADLNFYVCPHCREVITPIYDMKDYVTHLIKMLERDAQRGKGGNLESTIEKDAMLKLVRGVLTMSVRRRASDLHVDSEIEGAKIRARIDGMMYDLMSLPRSISPAFISAIKVMANLDITEKRIPQDGKVAMWIDKADVDLRINTSPAAMGEKVAIRILNQKSIAIDPTKLGMDGENLEKFERAIRKPHGLIVVTGPSGSGKSTTLYVALNELNTGEKNIITIEDPIEYQLKGLSQMQINPAANFTFATGLRSILRQDPDVIMVGEIRDKETADIAIEAATTGHLVFTTLHTIDAPTAFGRLADLGVETRRLSSAVICIIAVRLIRTVCSDCKKPYKPRKTDLETLGIATSAKDFTFVHGSGCDSCMNTGYLGRIGIYEFLVPDDSMREILETNAAVSVIRELAKKSGYRGLREEGIVKVMQGITTVEEVIRVTS